MTFDPQLAALAETLRRAGHTVVPHGDHICVRLPLLGSVRVRLVDGQLRFDPRYGAFGRTAAVYLDQLLGVGVVAGIATAVGMGGGTTLAAAGIAAVLVAILDACRFVSTESCISRLQTLWMLRHAPAGTLPAGAFTAGPAATAAALPREL